jgi:hypothetical protein
MLFIQEFKRPNLKLTHSTDVGFSSTYNDLLLSSCTSCAVRQDMSAYWTPTLMFEHANGTTEIVPQVGGMLMYVEPCIDDRSILLKSALTLATIFYLAIK